MCQNFIFFIGGLLGVVVVGRVLILIPFFLKDNTPGKDPHRRDIGVTKY